MSSNSRVAVMLTVVAALVFVAAFMPWGEVRGTPNANSPFGDGGLFGGMQITLTITGWNGSISLGGLKLPNWLVVLAAVGAAAVCWLRVAGIWASPTFVPFALAGYGLLHSVFAFVLLMGSDRASAGVGSLFTAAAFVAMLVLLFRQVREPGVESRRTRVAAPERGGE